jgi:hypothetical protein
VKLKKNPKFPLKNLEAKKKSNTFATAFEEPITVL